MSRWPHHSSTQLLIAVVFCCAVQAQSPQQLGAQAGAAMQRKDYAAAEAAYRQLLKQSPNIAQAYSNLGLACYMQNNFPSAEEAFLKALQLDNGLFVPNYLLGQIRFQQDRYQDALPVLQRAVAADPRQKPAWRLYVATLVGLKQYAPAIGEYQKALRSDASDTETYYGLGSVYLAVSQSVVGRLGRNSAYSSVLTALHYAPSEEWQGAALGAYKSAIARGPGIEGIRVDYARLLLARKEYGTARQTLEDELRLDENSFRARFYLAQVMLAQGDMEQALRRLEEAVHLRPEFFSPLPDLEVAGTLKDPAGCRSKLAGANRGHPFAAPYLLARLPAAASDSKELQNWTGQAERARDEIRRSLQREGGSLPATEKAGFDLLLRKRYERGLAILLPLARAASLRPETRLAVARALYRTQRFETLLQVFGKTDPGIAEINLLLGLAYKEVAFQTLARMVQLAPDSVRGHQVLGESFAAETRYSDAASEYEAAVKLKPGDPELHFALGESRFRLGEFQLALESFERALKLDPLNAEGHLMRGDCLVRLGETAKAVPELHKSLELNPRLAHAHVLLSKAYDEAGKIDLALAHLEKGVVEDQDGSGHYRLFLLYRKLNQPAKAQEALRRSRELREAAHPALEVEPQAH